MGNFEEITAKKKWNIDLICDLVLKHQIFREDNYKTSMKWKEAHKEYVEKSKNEITKLQLSKKWRNLVLAAKSRQSRIKTQENDTGNSQDPALTPLELKVLDTAKKVFCEIHKIYYLKNYALLPEVAKNLKFPLHMDYLVLF